MQMRRTPSRPSSVRPSMNLTSHHNSKYRMPPYDGKTNGRPHRGAPRNEYTDLDQGFLPSGSYPGPVRGCDEDVPPRVRRQPEGFLTEDNSSFAMKKLPKAAQPSTAAAEESILKKWEAWSTQIGTQLALESAVPTTSIVRGSSRNSSFRSISQLSNSSITKPCPGSGRGFSPLSQGGRRSVSRCSSRSRQSSLASTVVEPFRVGDRMTASAERKRHRPQSTKRSREVLFRRALGLEDDKDNIPNLSMTSATKRPLPAPGPLIAATKVSPTPRRLAEPSCCLPAEVKEVILTTKPQQTTELPEDSMPPKSHESTQSSASNARPHEELAVPELEQLKSSDIKETDDQNDEWLKKSIALLHSKDQPFTEAVAEGATPVNEGRNADTAEADVAAVEPIKAKWHLPVGEAAQMICGRVRTQTLNDCSVPVFNYLAATSEDSADPDIKLSPENEAIFPWVKWPIDRASVNVVFVEHRVDDDQLSAYGIEVSSREDYSAEVLPDWNESRRRFAPAPIEDSQAPT